MKEFHLINAEARVFDRKSGVCFIKKQFEFFSTEKDLDYELDSRIDKLIKELPNKVIEIRVKVFVTQTETGQA